MHFLPKMELEEETTTLNLISGKPDGSLAVMEYYKMALLYGGLRCKWESQRLNTKFD